MEKCYKTVVYIGTVRTCRHHKTQLRTSIGCNRHSSSIGTQSVGGERKESTLYVASVFTTAFTTDLAVDMVFEPGANWHCVEGLAGR